MRKRFYALCLMAALLSFLPGHASAESETAAPAAESAAVAAVEQTTPAVAKADVPQRAAPAKPSEKADAALPAQSEATSKAAAEEAPAASNAAAAPETPGPVAAADTEDTPVEEAPEEEKDAAIPDVTPPAEEAEAEGDEVQAATDDEADAIEAEPEKEAAADAAEITDGEKQEPADSAADTARDPEDGPAADSEAVADVLEAGTELDAEALARAPKALGAAAQAEEADAVVKVRSFDELKTAIQNAGSKKTVIKVMESFELTEKLTIAEDQNILLTADNEQTAEEPWKPIEQPADSNDAGEEKQRESIDAGRNRGKEALEKADTPLPSEEEGAIILKRAKEFVEDTLFAIFGTLTWGDEDSAIHIDGNEEVETEFDDRGAIATVENGGSLTLKNGTVMHANNKHGYTAPIKVKKGGTFTMEGGRISHNKSYERIDPDYTRPTSSGAVYVDPGSTFHMTGGMIDNNDGGMSGGVFAGSLFGSTGDPARVTIDGGIIANNRSKTRYQSGGGITIYPKAELHMNDGIVAGNKSGSGGGIAVSDQFLSEFSNKKDREYANTPADYEKHLKENKSEAFIDGGLIYKNKASTVGGGVYVDTNFVNFGKTMILDNKSENFGGGVYISFPPRIQTLENLLITKNTAGGDGGGLWNCPTGYVHIGDKHTVYVFDNEAIGRGKDIGFSKKTKHFLLNKENIQDKFYSHISPVTKDGNIIKFLEDSTKGVVIPDHMSYTDLMIYLKAQYDNALRREAWKNAKTFILGNTSRYGGGLGSNANLETPKDEGDYEIEIHKKWDESAKPEPNEEVVIELFIVPTDVDEDYVRKNYGTDPKLYKYGEITLTEKDDWKDNIVRNRFEKIDGLPAITRDKGLPFSAEELAKKGLKYLVSEKGDKYFTQISESKPVEENEVQAGTLEVERIYSTLSEDGYVYDKEPDDTKTKIYFYVYDPIKQELTRIAQTELNAENAWKATVAHPTFDKKISKIEYYGEDRKVTEYDEDWYNDVLGYDIANGGYAFVLLPNGDDTLTLQMPYLWIQKYDEGEGIVSGFVAKQGEEKQAYTISEQTHSFTVTNYAFGELNVEKSWKMPEAQLPKSVTLYLRLDGERIVDGYDEAGKPIYRTLTLTKEDGWKGSFDKLDPGALAKGRYTLEEDSDVFAPKFTPKDDTYAIRIEYADNYKPEADLTDDGLIRPLLTKDHFKDFAGNITLNLHKDGKVIDSKEFTWNKIPDPVLEGEFLTVLNKEVVFKSLSLPSYGTGIRVRSYDLVTNEPGFTTYDFYLKQGEDGFYTLYLPRLVIDGVPYELFNVTKMEPNKYSSYGKESIILPGDTENTGMATENHKGPGHEIEISKRWKGEGNAPDSITVVVVSENGDTREVVLNADGDWQDRIADLEGTFRKHGYIIREVKVPGYTGTVDTNKNLRIVDKDGKAVNFDETLAKKALESGKYRYEVIDGKDVEIIKEEDGSYLIRYPEGMKVTEILDVILTNTATPPDTPDNPPEEPNYGELIVSKTVIGEESGKDFRFRVVLQDANGAELKDVFDYLKERIDGETLRGSIQSGEIFTLKGGETFRILKLSYGTSYIVEELDKAGYTVTERYTQGVIGAAEIRAEFTNHKIPQEPPVTPPEVPEEPPVTPPEVPEEPPVTPPEVPEEPPVTPPDTPKVPPFDKITKNPKGKAPQTGIDGIGMYQAAMLLAMGGLAYMESKKRR